MRPIANFTLHAIIAAALAALAASSAAAAGQVGPVLELGKSDMQGYGAPPIELRSYSFGESSGAGRPVMTVADAVRVLNESRHSHGSDASAGTGKGTSNERKSAEGTASGGKMQPGGGGSAYGVKRVFVKSWSTGDAWGSGKGLAAAQDLPAVGAAYDAGSVTLTGAFPSCYVGAAYDGAAIGQGGQRYEMQDVKVAACAPGSMSLTFKKVTVRGWDPKKKEQ